MNDAPIKVMLADDHQVLRDGLRKSFQASGEVIVAEATNGEEAVEMAARFQPDVIVMDITMPILDGVGATRQIIEARPDARVVVLSMHDDVQRTRQALDAGAVGYLSKGTSFKDVLSTVRSAARGETSLSPALAIAMLQQADARIADDNEPLLSKRQVEILQLIANGQSTKQAARDLGISTKTVHNHLNAVYRRLDTQSLTHAVLSAVRLGIIELNPTDNSEE